MKLIYVAAPYAGDIEKNTEFAKTACRFVMDEGCAFFALHLLYPQVLNDSDAADRRYAFAMGKSILMKCDKLWVFGKTISAGMQEKINKAIRQYSIQYNT